MKYLLLASAATALLTSPAAAQDREDENVIVVLGEGLPDTPGVPAYSVVELEREQIVNTGSGTFEDALANVAGFQQFRRSDSRSSNPTAQGATLRALGGNASSRALVLLDGVPMTDPFFGYVPFNAIAPERLSSIRVTRGGGSGPFGSGALAGVVEVQSANAQELGLVNAQALVNDRGGTQASLTAAPSWDGGYAVASGRWDRGKGFFTTPEADRVPATARAAYDSWSASGRIVQQLGEDLEVQLRGLAFEDNRTLRFEGADSRIRGEDVSLRVVSRGDWQVDALAYAQWRNFSNVVISSTRFVKVLDQKDTPATGLGGKIEVRPPVGDNHTLRIGADYRRSDGDLFEDSFSAFSGNLTENRFAGGTNTDLGFFIDHDWTYGPITLTGGLRADRYTIKDGFYRALAADGAVITDDTYADRSDWEITWRAGARVQIDRALTMRAAAYSGFRLPTINELYRPFVVFPVVTQANAALEPERLEGWELGMDWQAADFMTLSATFFDNKVENAIANVTLQPNLRQRRNLDAIDAQGLEVATALDFGQFDFTGTLVFTAPEIEGTGPASVLDGNLPPQTPTFAASATASWQPVDGAVLAATLRHVGKQFESDQETEPLPATTTVDLFAQVPLFGQLSGVARVENLLDETVVTRNSGGAIDIGAPQTFWIGLRYGF
ncbi:TonB-dependent receptor plug domain-containing protein [Aurantiacibacter rhizosphaerae]|uniref:TonB-dependent receptor n=1 Tax=Aurantiacibacter rhizosphaerae TaxID=2691582 RepID=A0A844XH63_9SPHN|nr:TonB-dependent receptor [Aurantiacibacter rhizosphaerae]MWV29012.1 TonB-dependent receptor [Aurantiacibacter rhizosphaerae]